MRSTESDERTQAETLENRIAAQSSVADPPSETLEVEAMLPRSSKKGKLPVEGAKHPAHPL
jgi:hypothetical protein